MLLAKVVYFFLWYSHTYILVHVFCYIKSFEWAQCWNFFNNSAICAVFLLPSTFFLLFYVNKLKEKKAQNKCQSLVQFHIGLILVSRVSWHLHRYCEGKKLWKRVCIRIFSILVLLSFILTFSTILACSGNVCLNGGTCTAQACQCSDNFFGVVCQNRK